MIFSFLLYLAKSKYVFLILQSEKVIYLLISKINLLFASTNFLLFSALKYVLFKFKFDKLLFNVCYVTSHFTKDCWEIQLVTNKELTIFERKQTYNKVNNSERNFKLDIYGLKRK